MAPAAKREHLDFPYRIDARGRSARADEPEHVRDMIEQLLFTDPGERVNRPDFGVGLLRSVFAPNGPELSAALRFAVEAGLQRWLGERIEIVALEVVSDDARLTIDLSYRLRAGDEVRSELPA